MTHENPTPVAVCLVPVHDALNPQQPDCLLGILRNIEPGWGQGALPGGYVDKLESFEQAASRELEEETGLLALPDEWRLVSSSTSPSNRVLVFCQLQRSISLAQFLALRIVNPVEVGGFVLFKPERGVADVAFPLHEQAIEQFFKRSMAARIQA